MIYLQPVLPQMAAEARLFLGESQWTWESAAKPLLGTSILPYQPLATRLDAKAVSALIEPPAADGATAKVSRATAISAPTAISAATAASATTPAVPTMPAVAATTSAAQTAPPASISIDEFLRIDLRVAKIIEADFITGADKLLKLRLDVGELGERRNIRRHPSAYEPQALIGRLIVVVANLRAP